MKEESVPPILLLDAMLGELAKWLRFMGYDSTFVPNTSDLVIIRQARAQGRIVLTQDYALSKQRAITAIYIDSDNLKEQITQVQQTLGLPPDSAKPRCGICNTPLIRMPKEDAQSFVPPYVWRKHDTFSQCDGCQRVYWKGTHWSGIQELLDQ